MAEIKKCVLLTRPTGENESLASKLANSGWNVLVRPMLKIEGLLPRTQLLSNLTIFDKITGAGSHKVESNLHLHPKVNIIELKGNKAELEINHNYIGVEIDGKGELYDLSSSFHPEFGLSKDNRRLVFKTSGILPIDITTRITW